MNDNSKASSAVSSVSHTNSCLPPTAVLALAAALCTLAPVNGSAQERLYVVVSPLNSAGPSAILTFEVDPQGLLTQRESYPTGGSGSGGSSEQALALHPSGRFLFAPNNAS